MFYLGTALLLVAFFTGYMIKISDQRFDKLINKTLDILTLFILLLLGAELGGLDDLQSNLLLAGQNVLYFLAIVGLINILSLLLFLPKTVLDGGSLEDGQVFSALSAFTSSLKYPFAVIIGMVATWATGYQLSYLAEISNLLLIALLLLIGISVRNSGISIREILLNRRGVEIASVVIIGSLLGGYICTLFTETNLFAAFAVASGFGWYSLSGVLIGNSLGPVLGSTAFIFDLTRELIALTIIPMLMRVSAASAIGFSGATAMDFTLPLISRSGGSAIVPVALSSGFILSVLSPILILFFLSFIP